MALSNSRTEMKTPERRGSTMRKRTKMAVPSTESKKIDPPKERTRGKTCSVCTEQVKNIYELREHMLLHNLHMCTKCQRYFKYKRSFQNHRYFCQGTASDDHVSKSKRKNQSSNEGTQNEDDGDMPSEKVCSKANDAVKRGDKEDNKSELDLPVSSVQVKSSPSKEASIDKKDSPEVPVKRRRGRPPGSTSKLSRPTLVPVPDCTPLLRKRSYRSLSSLESDFPDLHMGITPQSNSPTPTESKGSYYDIPTDVTSTTNTHSSCVVHSGNLNSSCGSSSSNSACCHTPYSSQIFMPSPVMSPFSNSKESSFVWQGIQIQGEKSLVTRMEGINPVTEQQYILYKCCLCGNAFPGVALLANHLMAHTRGTKEHSCQKCGAIFKWRSQLEVHEQVHQVMDSRLAAPTSSSCMMFMNSVGLMGSSDNFVNPSLCPRSLSLLPTCGVGPGMFYPPSVSPAATPEGITPTSSAHNSVITTVNSAENSIEDNSKTVPKQNGQTGKSFFQCKFCSKSFDRLFSLQRHERIHTGIKPCFCKLCGKGFSERRNLRHHIIRFHSDGNQRDLFRRNRRPKTRTTNNSSLKLVSFLKRTAVRILNSMDQSRFDSELNEAQQMQTTLPEGNTSVQNIKFAQQQCVASIKNSISDIEADEKQPVTVVIPTDAPSDLDQASHLSSNHGSGDEERELLQDPKRSLIGNRRKGRPFRLTNVHNNLVLEDEDSQLENLCNGKFSNFPIETSIKEEPNMFSDGENGALCSNLLQVTLTENTLNGIDEKNFHPDGVPTFKARLRGHGAFFSSYNPSTTRPKELKVYKSNTSRLGVVAKPVIRTEACKPQIGPDGKFVYPCSYCYKTFCSTSDLNRHMDFHEDVRPFKCPYCSYYSRTNSQLKVHMMRHQGIKHFLCHICNYNGVTQSDLNRHNKTRTHLLRTRNVCSSCSLGFYTRSLLEEHERMYNHSGRNTESDTILAKIKEEATDLNDPEGTNTNPDDDSNNNDSTFNSRNSKDDSLLKDAQKI